MPVYRVVVDVEGCGVYGYDMLADTIEVAAHKAKSRLLPSRVSVSATVWRKNYPKVKMVVKL